ncbi:GNAT family N-acetyltransferase [Acidovorax temperans]
MWCDLDTSLLAPDLSLRLSTDSDLPFLKTLYRTVRDPELALTGWSEEQKQAFSDSQFSLQDQHYRKYYPGAQFLVIQHQCAPAGRVYLARVANQLRLMDLALMPHFRGRGWGSSVVRVVLDHADRERLETLLFVESSNPAYALYLRNGFLSEGLEGVYVRMRRPASCAFDTPARSLDGND